MLQANFSSLDRTKLAFSVCFQSLLNIVNQMLAATKQQMKMLPKISLNYNCKGTVHLDKKTV